MATLIDANLNRVVLANKAVIVYHVFDTFDNLRGQSQSIDPKRTNLPERSIGGGFLHSFSVAGGRSACAGDTILN